MDHDEEIAALGAETLALQAILTNVLLQLGKEDVALALAIRRGFDDAVNEIEDLAISAKRPGPIMLSKMSALSRNCGPHLLAIETSLNTQFKLLGLIMVS